MSTTKYIVDNKSEQTINGERVLRPYKVYTAILNQSGTSSILEITNGDLIVGVTYEIYEAAGGAEGFDFTNVGAPNNNFGTFFVATGTTPASWGNANVGLRYDEGAPTVIVLENTIGNVGWTRTDAGIYLAVTDTLYTNSKTMIFQENGNINNSYEVRTRRIDDSNIEVNSMEALTSNGYDGEIINMSIEIRVYN